MSTKVNLPRSGMGIDEGTVLRWLRAEGDSVKQGDPLVEVETAKAVQEIAAPVDGRLSRILVTEGQVVAVNSDLALIDSD